MKVLKEQHIIIFNKKELNLLQLAKKKLLEARKIDFEKVHQINTIFKRNGYNRNKLLEYVQLTDYLSEGLYDIHLVLESIEMSDFNRKLNRVYDENR